METTGDGKRTSTLLGAGAICAAAHLVDILCARLSDPDSAALTANVALPLDLMVGGAACALDSLCPTAWEVVE